MSETLFPRDLVQEVYLELARWFDPQPAWEWAGAGSQPRPCPHARAERVCAVGGFRRRKAAMKDLELLYIPRLLEQADAGDLFGATSQANLSERLIDELRTSGVLAKRLNVDGHATWGPWNKHAVHVATGLPIDLFAATAESYFNRLVVTTGPAELNIRIASAARTKGWEWKTTEPGFVPLGGSWEGCQKARRTMRSEAEVFAFVDLECLPPEERK